MKILHILPAIYYWAGLGSGSYGLGIGHFYMV